MAFLCIFNLSFLISYNSLRFFKLFFSDLPKRVYLNNAITLTNQTIRATYFVSFKLEEITLISFSIYLISQPNTVLLELQEPPNALKVNTANTDLFFGHFFCRDSIYHSICFTFTLPFSFAFPFPFALSFSFSFGLYKYIRVEITTTETDSCLPFFA